MESDNFLKIKALHQKYASGNFPELFFELVWTHCIIVGRIATIIADDLEKVYGITVDRKLLEIGSLIHDIGWYRVYDEELNVNCTMLSLMHGFMGAHILREENLPDSWGRFCEVHTATGLTKEDIEREHLDVPTQDYVPITLEEEMVTYADKFHSKVPCFNTYDVISKNIAQFDPDRKIRFEGLKKKFGVPNTEILEKEYAPWDMSINERINKALEEKKNI